MTNQNFTKRIMWLVISIILFTALNGQAQTFKLDPNKSIIAIAGTSNLHDWDSKASKISGSFVMNSSKQVAALLIKIPVKSIKSGNGIMDDKTYDTFDADKNPTIIFKLTETAKPDFTDANNIPVALIGNLTMAGVTKKVSFKATGKSIGNGAYKFTANVPVKMSDYKMEAPTAMFGAMKVGDAVTLKLDITITE